MDINGHKLYTRAERHLCPQRSLLLGGQIKLRNRTFVLREKSQDWNSKAVIAPDIFQSGVTSVYKVSKEVYGNRSVTVTGQTVTVTDQTVTVTGQTVTVTGQIHGHLYYY